jgi:hypothetical protein
MSETENLLCSSGRPHEVSPSSNLFYSLRSETSRMLTHASPPEKPPRTRLGSSLGRLGAPPSEHGPGRAPLSERARDMNVIWRSIAEAFSSSLGFVFLFLSPLR